MAYIIQSVELQVTYDLKRTSEMLEQFNLSQRTLCKNLLVEDIGNLLDCDALLSLRIRSSTISLIVSLDQYTLRISL
jgi:hypothetical protein